MITFNGPITAAQKTNETQTEAGATTEQHELDLFPEYCEMMASGDLGQMIAALMIKMSEHQRDTAREMKDAALASELAAQEKKIESMTKEAEAKLISGVVAGGMTIGAGACQVVSGAVDGDKAQKIWKGAGTGMEGGAKVVSSIGDFNAATHARDGVRAENVAKQANRNVEAATDNDKDARETARKAIDLLKEWQGAKDSASKAALFRA